MQFRSIKYCICFILLNLFLSIESYSTENITSIATFLVTLKGNLKSDSFPVILNWNDISKQPVKFNESAIVVIDLNNSSKYYPTVFTNKENLPDKILFYTKYDKNEPLRPFEIIIIKSNLPKNIIKADPVTAEKSYSVNYLKTTKEYFRQSFVNIKWSDKIAESVMATYPDPVNLDIFRSYDWSYTNGFMMNAFFELYKKTQDKKYLAYVKKWYSYFVNSSGQIDSTKYEYANFELDGILPGRTLISLYKETGEEKYKIASETLLNQLKHQPRTNDGGYWHKKVYMHQMWLDGIYMADVFLLQYAQIFSKPQFTIEGTNQFLCAYKHMNDPNTGLLYHGWDELKKSIWANPQTGASHEFWSRGIGWYIMALADGIQYIPESFTMHDSLLSIFQNVSKAVAKYQDQRTGLWYQVTDKGNKKDNWIETSASAMFAYAFIKGYKNGMLDKSFKESATNAFNGLKNNYIYFDAEGKIYLTGTVKVGTLNLKSSDGSYRYYTSVDRRVNDFKGLAALLYLAMELEYK